MNQTAYMGGGGGKSNHVHWLMRLAECELAKNRSWKERTCNREKMLS